MNKETHEQEIEVELLNPDEIETQEEEDDFSAFALDESLIEELYQEQMQEQIGESDGEDKIADAAKDKSAAVNHGNQSGEDTAGQMSAADGKRHPEESTAERIAEVNERIQSQEDIPEFSTGTDEKSSPEKTADDMTYTGKASEDEKIVLAADGTEEAGAADDRIVLDEEDLTGADVSDAPDGAADGTEETGEPEGKQKKKKSVFRKIAKGVLITFEVLVLALIVYVVAILVQADSTTDLVSRLSQSLLGKTLIAALIQDDYEDNVQETIDSEQISTNEGLDVTPYTLEGDYTSFVIFGVDARGDEFDSGTNSDTIIIVTIQNETGRVRMASIYRDTYLQIESNNGDVHYAKANSAYSSGGAVRALNMLNTNFDLALEDYVVVNFAGVADIIDALGGLDITLSEGEVSQLNYHLSSSISSTGLTADKITSAGLNHLNGVQALTYARIRKTTFTDPDTGEEYNNDYGRTKRQQYVITLLAEKAKTASVSELTSIVTRIFSYNTDEEKVIGTTYSFDEIIAMIPLALTFTLDGGEGYPDNKTTRYMSDLNGADCVIATDLVADVTALHEFLYDEEDYVPTAVVRNIAATILERAETYGTTD